MNREIASEEDDKTNFIGVMGGRSSVGEEPSVENAHQLAGLQPGMGSFGSVRLAPHFGQDDRQLIVLAADNWQLATEN
jgi:hypothetical protein